MEIYLFKLKQCVSWRRKGLGLSPSPSFQSWSCNAHTRKGMGTRCMGELDRGQTFDPVPPFNHQCEVGGVFLRAQAILGPVLCPRHKTRAGFWLRASAQRLATKHVECAQRTRGLAQRGICPIIKYTVGFYIMFSILN
jgi:hypothetical protein